MINGGKRLVFAGKKSLYNAPDTYTRANAIGWQMVRRPKNKYWQIVEENDGWRALRGLKALN